MGITKESRQSIFAMSVAPIQVNYLGYPSTMAADYMDYLIADHTLIPDEKQKNYLEKIAYMPNSYQPNLSKRSIFEISPLRQEQKLPEKSFVFCCFNNQSKITPSTFAGWMRILKATNDSVLWLLVKSISATNNLKKEAIKFGINKDRLIFARYISNDEHLKRIQSADLFLDTSPYNAHTTASDALKMGLPVLTYIGKSFASRVAASLLKAVNLPELITATQEEYESLAIKLATDSKKMKIIKNKLVDNLSTSPLYNTSLYIQHLEVAYLTMYKRYQNGLNPDYIEINTSADN
jgi:predicted O-linked N-acetylglucosamine transferase (SPINDLY family)